MSGKISAVANEVRRLFPPDRLEGKVCDFVFSRLQEQKTKLHHVNPANIAQALMMPVNNDTQGVIVSALNFLASGKNPVLRIVFYYWDSYFSDGAVLEEPIAEIDENQFRDALEFGYLAHPITGDMVALEKSHITVAYEVTEYAHSIASEEDGYKSRNA